VAILGATGAGKTTLVNLIPRLYDVTEGSVSIAETDVRRLQLDDLLSNIAMVPQEAMLFAGTISDNIRYGCPDAGIEEVMGAARAACAHEFIVKLPHGYESRVHGRGVNLSGGQKQRITIARALLMRPDILILDDATSSVDVETEIGIHAAVAEWMTGRTVIMVSQRLSTVLKADKIVILEKGRIVGEGTHRDLLQSSSIYREIYASQLEPEIGFGETARRAIYV